MSFKNYTPRAGIEPGPGSPSVPISTLHHDSLYEIFLWNTLSTNQGLDTTRCASQVCRTWRSLILNSPNIWGRLVDLRALNQKTDHWRDQVLRRSGNSLLWVIGVVSGTRTNLRRPATSFFYTVLDSHWERIQDLSINIPDDSIEESLWRPLLRPAPNLRLCSLHFNIFNLESLFSTFESPTTPLFSNHAPSLYHLAARGFSLKLSTSWLSHLRSLQLLTPIYISAILSALCSTPFLESLTIGGLRAAEPRHTPTSLPSANVPHLTQLVLLKTRLDLVADFLTHIHPADGCALVCTCEVNSHADVIADLEASCPILSRTLQRYLLTHTVTSIGLNLFPDEFSFWDHESDNTFTICINSDDWSALPADSYPLFHSVLSNCDLSYVTKLDLKLSPLPPTFPAVYFLFFSSFPSITDLSVNEQTLQIILDMPPNENEPPAVVFPLLHTLALDLPDEACRDPGPILQYLRRRNESGTPIRKIFLGLLDDWMEAHDMKASLEEMTGLLVLWRDESDEEFEYICGSGQPEALFVAPSPSDV